MAILLLGVAVAVSAIGVLVIIRTDRALGGDGTALVASAPIGPAARKQRSPALFVLAGILSLLVLATVL